MRGVYPIVDLSTLQARNIDPLAFAADVLAAGPCALQLRAKEQPPEEVLKLLRALGPMCRAASVPLVCNDSPDLALLAECEMLHLGQEDASIELVRRGSPDLRIGLSTHDLEQLDIALAARPAYVAYGPVFPTTSKRNPDRVVGLEGLRAAAERTRHHGTPLVAIGGITLETLPEVARIADVAAIIAAFFAEGKTVREQALALRAAFGGS